MSEVKREEKRGGLAFSLSFSGAVRLGQYRKLVRKLGREATQICRDKPELARAVGATFPKVHDMALAAIKTIENERYFSRHAELFSLSEKILSFCSSEDGASEGDASAEKLSEQGIRKFLSETSFAEDYSFILLLLLPSALILKLTEKYADSLLDEAKIYAVSDMLGNIGNTDFYGIAVSFCASARIYYGEAADIFRYCSDETKNAYLRITAERAYLCGMSEAAYALEVNTEAGKRGVHIGEILLRRDGFAGRVYFVLPSPRCSCCFLPFWRAVLMLCRQHFFLPFRYMNLSSNS